MPIGKAGVSHIINTLRVIGIGNVHDDPVARARSSRKVQRREDRDVVAHVSAVGLLRTFAMVSAAPQASNFTVRSKNTRAGRDARR